MASTISDDAFARAVNQMGAATLEQIETARQIQAASAQKGVLITLADVLIQQSIIPPAFKENIEKKLLAAQQGGIKQLGNFKLIKKLGEGGMGAVYLADDIAAGRKVALKILPKKHAGNSEFITRFRREAQATGKLNHVNIVSAFTVGEELGNHYYAMEYFEGEPLDAQLKRDRFLPWEKAIEIVMQVARGLKHAHEHSFIHRDIKPANIFITKDGVAKILDLGLSKNISDTEQSFNTQTGVAMGTPHYISPEQARGDKGIDGRTDIYSLGATFYHLITGETPFQGSTAAVIMMKHLNDQLPNPQDNQDEIPDGIVQVIQKMMAKEPSDRYADCAELLADLELVIDGKMPSSLAIDVGKSSIAMPRARRRSSGAEEMPRKGRTGGTIPPRHEPAAGRREADRRDADRRVISPAKQNKTPMYVAGGVSALGVLVLAIVFLSSGKKAETALHGDVEAEKKPAPIGVESATSIVIPAETLKTPVVSPTKVLAAPNSTGGVDDAWVKSVQALAPEEQVKKVVEKLRDLNPGWNGPVFESKVENGFVTKLRISSNALGDVSPLRALSGLSELGCRPHISGQHGTLQNLTPLSGMKLQVLAFQSNEVRELSPLKGMPLKWLYIGGNPVEDLSPLAGMSLIVLSAANTQVKDWSAIKDMPIKNLECDFVPTRDGAILKSIKTLEKINEIPVAEFWAKNVIDDPARWTQAVDLLKLFDPKNDKVAGSWSVEHDRLVSTEWGSRIELPIIPPAEYDVRATFSVNGTEVCPFFLLSRGGASFVVVAGWLGSAGVEDVDKLSLGEQRDKAVLKLAEGVSYTAVCEVRNHAIRLFINGQLIFERNYGNAQLSRNSGKNLKDNLHIGLGSTREGSVAFESYQLLEITGKGTFTRPIDPAAVDAEKKRKGAPAPENPYVNARVGDWTEYHTLASLSGVQSDSDIKKTVISKTAQLVTVESLVKFGKDAGATAGKEDRSEIKIDLSKPYNSVPGVEAENLMGIKVLGSGDENLTVGGKTLATHWTQRDVTISTQGTTFIMKLKENVSPDVPLDGMAKAELDTLNLRQTTVLVAYGFGETKTDALPKELTLDLGGGVKMEMVLVPAGEFMMGADDGRADEKPVHKVKISQPYYIGKYDVTVAQFRRFAEATKFETGPTGRTLENSTWKAGITWKTPGFKQEENHPVVVVSWDECQAFAAWASKQTGREVRLPTEAQWEYAARGPENRKYPWGDKWDCALANHGDATLKNTGFQGGCTSDSDGFAYTSPVGNYKNASWCGAFDMAGNVWQWVADGYNEKYYASSPAADPLGPGGGNHVARGGSWENAPGDLRSTRRTSHDFYDRYSVQGFRVKVPAVSKTP